MHEQYRDDEHVLGILASGNEAELAELEHLLDNFPHGVDEWLGRPWIINAIDCGSFLSIEWMLSRHVDLSFKDEEGFTVLHSAIDRALPDRHKVIELLLRHKAPVNMRGTNDWTPAHLAAVREDIEALKLLIQFGADLSIRTRIDDYATPLEQARRLKKALAVEFLNDLR